MPKLARSCKLLFALRPDAVKGGVPLSESESRGDLAWLQSKAEEGHVPLLYALAWKTQAFDEDESRKWNARSRIGGMLDGAECVGRPQQQWFLLLEGGFLPNIESVRSKNLSLWYQAVEEALLWNKARSSRVSAQWLCGKENLLPADQAEITRKTRIEGLIESNRQSLEKARVSTK